MSITPFRLPVRVEALLKHQNIICLVTTILLVATFDLLMFDRFFPVSEGWFTVYAQCINAGWVPYRDFDLCIPPLYPALLAGIVAIFGAKIIVLRILGILLFSCMTLVLYRIFRYMFNPVVSSIITTGAIIYYKSNVAHITYDFLHFVTLFALLSAYLTIRSAISNDGSWRKDSIKRYRSYSMAIGCCAAGAFLIKQSNGLYIAFSCAAAMIAVSIMRRDGRVLTSCIWFAAGAILVSFPVIIYLQWHSALIPFYSQVFVHAAHSKGSFLAIIFAWLPRLITIEHLLALCAIALTMWIAGYQFNIFPKLQNESEFRDTYNKWWSVLMLLPLFFILFVSYRFTNIAHHLADSFCLTKFYEYMTIFIVSSSIVALVVYAISRTIDYSLGVPLIVSSIASLGMLMGTTTSAAMGEAGGLIGFGLFFGFLLSSPSRYQIGKAITFVAISLLIGHVESEKFITPYYWWSLHQCPVRLAKFRSTIPMLQGLRMSRQNRDAIDGVYDDLIKYNANNSNDVFTFPNIPVFTSFIHSLPYSRHVVLWFDVASDYEAQQAAQELNEKHTPRFIIWLDLPNFVWDAHEVLFRDGNPCGQRAIKKAVDSLTESRYTLDAAYPLDDGCMLKIWRRTAGD